MNSSFFIFLGIISSMWGPRKKIFSVLLYTGFTNASLKIFCYFKSESLSLWKLKTSFIIYGEILATLYISIARVCMFLIWIEMELSFFKKLLKKRGFVAIYWPKASFMSHERHLYTWTIVNVNKKLCSGPGIPACSFLLVLEHKFSLLNWKLVLLLKVTPIVFHFKYFWW